LTAPITFDATNKLIQVGIAVTSVTNQQIVNAIRDYETTAIDTCVPFADIQGKKVLEGSITTGICVELLDDWRVQFAPRGGPAWVNCQVIQGDLIATNSYGNDPFCPAAFVNMTRAMSTAATIVTTGGLTPTQQEIRDAMKLAPSVGAAAEDSIDDKLDDMPADVDIQLGSTHGTHQWQKTRQYP
jgi:hypothetical protein